MDQSRAIDQNNNALITGGQSKQEADEFNAQLQDSLNKQKEADKSKEGLLEKFYGGEDALATKKLVQGAVKTYKDIKANPTWNEYKAFNKATAAKTFKDPFGVGKTTEVPKLSTDEMFEMDRNMNPLSQARSVSARGVAGATNNTTRSATSEIGATSRTAGSTARGVTSEIGAVTKEAGATDKLISSIGDTVGKVGMGLSAYATVSAITDDAEGNWSGMSDSGKWHNITGILQAPLDIAAAFVPILEPLAIIDTAVSGVTGGVAAFSSDEASDRADEAQEKALQRNGHATMSLASIGALAGSQSSAMKQVGTTGNF